MKEKRNDVSPQITVTQDRNGKRILREYSERRRNKIIEELKTDQSCAEAIEDWNIDAEILKKIADAVIFYEDNCANSIFLRAAYGNRIRKEKGLLSKIEVLRDTISSLMNNPYTQLPLANAFGEAANKTRRAYIFNLTPDHMGVNVIFRDFEPPEDLSPLDEIAHLVTNLEALQEAVENLLEDSPTPVPGRGRSKNHVGQLIADLYEILNEPIERAITEGGDSKREYAILREIGIFLTALGITNNGKPYKIKTLYNRSKG